MSNFITITELVQSLKEVTSILRAVRYTVGLGKNQLIRLERAEGLIAKATEAKPSPPEFFKELTETSDVHFYDTASGREMKLVQSGMWAGWICYKHPDGQWVTLREATEADQAAISRADKLGELLRTSVSTVESEQKEGN